MAIIDQMVDVIITRDRLDFSTLDAEPELLLIGDSKPALSGEVKTYYNLEDVLVDYPAVDGVFPDEYKFTAAYFAQTVRPNVINIGQRLAQPDPGTRETYIAAYTRIKTFFRRFYFVALAGGYDAPDVKAVAAQVQTEERAFEYLSTDPATLTTATTSIADFFKNLEYDRTFGVYTPVPPAQEDEFDNAIHAAWTGLMVPKPVGSANWAYKSLRGVTTYPLTEGEYVNATGKNINVYINEMGFPITRTGVMASGDPIHLITGTDFLRNLIRYEFMRMLTSNDLVPYTDTGIRMGETAILVALNRAVERGIITPVYQVYSPKLKDVTNTDLYGLLARYKVETTPTLSIDKAVITTNVSLQLIRA